MLEQFKQILLLTLTELVTVPLSILLICHSGSANTPEAEVIYHTQQLADQNTVLSDRVSAASALGNPYLGVEDAIQPLIIALRQDSAAAVRITAAAALANRSLNTQRRSLLPLFELGVPALIDALERRQEANPDVRAKAAEALGLIIEQAKANASLTESQQLIVDRAIAALVSVLEKETEEAEVRAKAAYALGLIGASSSITLLVDVLSDATQSQILRARTADALAFLGQQGVSDRRAVSVLIQTAQENEVGLRLSSVYAIGEIGTDAESAVPTLIDRLKQDFELEVRRRAAFALRRVAFDLESIATLIAIVKDESEEDALRITAASSLGAMAENFKTSLPSDAIAALANVLAHQNSELRANAALALKSANGAEAQTVVPALLPLLKDKVDWVRNNAATALKEVVVRFQDADKATRRSLKELDQLISDAEKASAALRQANFSQHAVDVDRALNSLRLQRQTSFLGQALGVFQTNPWSRFIMGYFIVMPSFWGIIFWLSPLTLLRIDRILDPLKSIELSGIVAFNLKLPLQTILYLTFFEAFHYRPRVLDAWVASYFQRADAKFKEDKTVRQHEIRVPITVDLNKVSVGNLTNKDLQPIFSRNLSYVLIWGEGGSGKTSLACQIARWGMLGQESGLCKHMMLPVLIDHFNPAATEGKDTFIQAISRNLQLLIDASNPISEELLKRLLKKRRILVLLDGLSEMSEDIQKSVRFGDPEFPVNALIVTSRLQNITKEIDFITEIEPQKFEKNSLSTFMENYLKERKIYDAFGNKEYFKNCLGLIDLVDDRDGQNNRKITVLLAKLYAEEMVKRKESGSSNSLPENIPDLMLSYLDNLKSRKYKEIEIQEDMKKIAWEGLKETYQPGPIKRNDLLRLLNDQDEEVANNKLEHFEKELGLIKTLLPDNDLLQITLDPLAEYLAGLYLLKDHGADETKWRDFLEKVDAKNGAKIKGFLLAVQDCCDYRKNPEHPRFARVKPPDFVLSELDKRIAPITNSAR